MNRRFVLAVARREARASGRRFLLYGGCMALGIAVLVGLHGARTSVRHSVDQQSQRLLGADLRLASREPLGPELEALVDALRGDPPAASARVTRFASMALATASGRSRLVDVHGVEGPFPLHGEIRTEPAGRWARLLAGDASEPLALVDPSLLIQLDASVGDELALGEARLRIAGVVTRAPGSFGLRTRVAPRVFIAGRSVEQTGLVRPGSLVQHLLYLELPAERARAWVEEHRPTLDAAGVRVQTVRGFQEDFSESFGSLTRFLALVGLAALALGGVGIASGVRVFVREKLDTVAILRSLGARPRDVLAAYGMLALAGGAAAGVAGSLLGLGLQGLLPPLVEGFLPVEVSLRLDPLALLTGVGLGLWVTALFALGPLLDLAAVPPLRALRRDLAGGSPERRGRAGLVLALATTILVASLWQAPRPLVGLAFAAGLLAALALLAGAASGAAALLRRHRLRRAPFWLRQGVANLFRPRNHTVATTLAIGFGLFLVATLHGVERNVMQQIARDTRADRPNFVLFDVQPDQLASLEAFLAEREVTTLDRAALVSARIAALRRREAAEWLAEDPSREFRWALRREYRLTYAAELRNGNRVVDGRWWDERDGPREGPVPVSLEADLAESLGAEVGDAITWNVQGVRIESAVASLRRVDWGRLATNFFAVFPPGVLEAAPQTNVLLTRVDDPDARARLQRDLVARYPNVSALDATLVLRAFDSLLGEVGTAVRLLALVTVVTGFAILVAAAATARDERLRESLLLRTLGAPKRTVRRIVVTEALALGVLAASVGSVLSLLATWALVRLVFELPFSPPLAPLLGLALATVLLTALLGAGGTGSALSRSPLAALRDAELRGAGAG